MNTRFSYLYRDACNYKKFNDVVLSGIIQEKQIAPFLKDKLFFIPSDVGLPDLQDDTFSVDDHIWHEFEKIELTEEPPNLEIVSSLLIEKFKDASQNNWNEYAAFKRKGLL
jgi:hypothetical protein